MRSSRGKRQEQDREIENDVRAHKTYKTYNRMRLVRVTRMGLSCKPGYNV